MYIQCTLYIVLKNMDVFCLLTFCIDYSHESYAYNMYWIFYSR